MTMIKLSDGLYVAASQITEVYVNPFSNGITVVTKDGVRHNYPTEPPGKVITLLLQDLWLRSMRLLPKIKFIWP